MMKMLNIPSSKHLHDRSIDADCRLYFPGKESELRVIVVVVEQKNIGNLTLCMVRKNEVEAGIGTLNVGGWILFLEIQKLIK